VKLHVKIVLMVIPFIHYNCKLVNGYGPMLSSYCI
jgi:hypothetical protein